MMLRDACPDFVLVSSSLGIGGTGVFRVDGAVEVGLFGVDFVRRRGDGAGEEGERRV